MSTKKCGPEAVPAKPSKCTVDEVSDTEVVKDAPQKVMWHDTENDVWYYDDESEYPGGDSDIETAGGLYPCIPFTPFGSLEDWFIVEKGDRPVECLALVIPKRGWFPVIRKATENYVCYMQDDENILKNTTIIREGAQKILQRHGDTYSTKVWFANGDGKSFSFFAPNWNGERWNLEYGENKVWRFVHTEFQLFMQLPVEIYSMIFEGLDSLETLYSAVCTCRFLHDCYLQHDEQIVLSIFRQIPQQYFGTVFRCHEIFFELNYAIDHGFIRREIVCHMLGLAWDFFRVKMYRGEEFLIPLVNKLSRTYKDKRDGVKLLERVWKREEPFIFSRTFPPSFKRDGQPRPLPLTPRAEEVAKMLTKQKRRTEEVFLKWDNSTRMRRKWSAHPGTTSLDYWGAIYFPAPSSRGDVV